MSHKEIMRHAIRLSIENVDRGGGPFAAVIACDGEIIASGVNTVAGDNDPTAHAEVNAIRKACSETGDFQLNGCTLYTTCEPCPMCLGAVYWSGISEVYYGNSREDAAQYGFRDEHIYEEIERPLDKRQLDFTRILETEAVEAFNLWDQKSDKIQY